MPKYDFGGYATRNDMQCTDGRIIRNGAFKDQYGTRVPLVWQHQRDGIENILGHADLEERPDGVYARVKFNDTPKAKIAKALVQHRDLNSLSIYANNLMQKGRDVLHGTIREVSLVLAGANPGAVIDNVYIQHSDGSVSESDEEVILCPHIDVDVEDYEMEHEDQNGSEKTVKEIIDSMTEEQKNAVYAVLGMALSENQDDEDDDNDVQHADTDDGESTIADIFDTFTDEQRDAVYEVLGMALQENRLQHSDEDDEDEDEDVDEFDDYEEEDEDSEDDEDFEDDEESDDDFDEDEDYDNEYEHSDEEGDNSMNLFESSGATPKILEQSKMEAILKDAPRIGSLRQAALEHGVTGIDVMFPEAKTVGNVPEVISRDQAWVSKVMNDAKKSPFKRVKSIVVNLTMDEARARGYIKGKKKIDEQFTALKRVTEPTTIYKKQSFDRDDILDIVDFDFVSFIKTEMRAMLNEETARASLIGDGRPVSDDSHINPQNIRPIYGDSDVYTIYYDVTLPTSGDTTETSNAIVDAANMARVEYKGSGMPTFYADPKTISTLLMARDKIGNRMYRNMSDLAAALRVSEVVEVPVMENITRTTDEGVTKNLLGIIVNYTDYTFGADRGGQVAMFDDFDIDYNKNKYLIETRCSGALTRPKSAIALETNA